MYIVDSDNELLLPRYNRDDKVCGYGRELLYLCATTGQRIVNGKHIGDLEAHSKW